MANLIPSSEQQNVMENFWMMMRECESRANDDKDPVLMVWVEGWYRLYSRITRPDQEPLVPVWMKS